MLTDAALRLFSLVLHYFPSDSLNFCGSIRTGSPIILRSSVNVATQNRGRKFNCLLTLVQSRNIGRRKNSKVAIILTPQSYQSSERFSWDSTATTDPCLASIAKQCELCIGIHVR
ncbi:hypothetical protein PILCRDRAFT_466105 [Piloderma croceum F 1598]|uniref:Uncharacterized protein n=1 Tax=Piloderma croceum (strain F 1598) TaxID=765440 RepID=A0A0C3FS10_PILCF|nr:hypothetical protein PILCRDRAFT_466105 [Piloderma croceum F 1598]